MGKLAEALGAIDKSKKGPRCGVDLLLTSLNKQDAEEARAVIADETLACSIVSKGIAAAYGQQVGGHTIARHRRGDCSCRS